MEKIWKKLEEEEMEQEKHMPEISYPSNNPLHTHVCKHTHTYTHIFTKLELHSTSAFKKI